MRYGEDYKEPCVRYAIDILNDVATQFSAAMYIRNQTLISSAMNHSLSEVYTNTCLSTLNSFNLMKPTLPQDYENSIAQYNNEVTNSIKVKQ